MVDDTEGVGCGSEEYCCGSYAVHAWLADRDGMVGHEQFGGVEARHYASGNLETAEELGTQQVCVVELCDACQLRDSRNILQHELEEQFTRVGGILCFLEV
jgi:hypothetical protein